MKLIEEYIGEKLHYIRFGNDLLDMTPKARQQKKKIGKLDFIKFKKICTSRT